MPPRRTKRPGSEITSYLVVTYAIDGVHEAKMKIVETKSEVQDHILEFLDGDFDGDDTGIYDAEDYVHVREINGRGDAEPINVSMTKPEWTVKIT